MTADHVHSDFDSPSAWSINKLRWHLARQHELVAPMSQDIGGLHQAHLVAHAGPVRAKQTEESPVLTHDHNNDVPGFHAHTDRRAVAYHLESAHDLDPEKINLREVYDQHIGLHYPASEERVERLAESLYNRDAPGTDPDWDDLGQETRDHYRDRAREELAKPTVQQAPVPAEENPQIRLDRIIAALAGVDFDQDWAADSGMGPRARGALRETYRTPAMRLLEWLERGGALALPAVASLADDLDRITKGNQRNIGSINALEERIADLEGQLELSRQNHGKALEAGRVLENARDDAQEQLEACQEDYRRVCRKKQDAEDELRWLRVSRAKESVSTDLNAMAPLSPDEAVCSDELPQINQPFKGLTLEVPPGTNRLMLSFVQEPEPEDKPLAAEPS